MFVNTFCCVPKSLSASLSAILGFSIHSGIVIHKISFGNKYGLPFSIKYPYTATASSIMGDDDDRQFA